MRGLRSTLILLVVFVGLGGYAYFIESERDPASEVPPVDQVFDFEEDNIRALRVTADNGEVTHLQRTDADEWEVTAPIKANADVATASAIARGLVSLEVRRVVEEDAADLAPFGLEEPSVDVAFALEDSGEFQHLFIGDVTPTGADQYAVIEGTKRVFLIYAYHKSTFNQTTFDLRDKTIFEFVRDDVDRFETVFDAQAIHLVKTGNNWRLNEPWNTRADATSVESLLGSLNTGKMLAIASEETDESELYGLAVPRLSVTVGAGNAAATLHIGNETPDGTIYARDASRPLIFTIESSLVTDLMKGAGDYRQKDLFRFRQFNASSLAIEREEGTVAFEKIETTTVPEEEASVEAVWKQVEPDDAEVERSQMDDLLAQLSNLRAESFVDSRNEMELIDNTPLATIRVRFGGENNTEPAGGEEDIVLIWQSGENTYAVHGYEPGAARINTRAFDEALEALGEVLGKTS